MSGEVECARRVAGYFAGAVDWDDLTDDERTGILTASPTGGPPPWSDREGGVTDLRVVRQKCRGCLSAQCVTCYPGPGS